MKRRSARPFMVEIKSTRTTRASLTTAQPRTRSDKSLWPELVQDEVKPAQPGIQAAPPPRLDKEPGAPVRRVLPSLVPMFQAPAEPVAEPEPEAALAPAPRVRRPRARSERAPASTQAALGASAPAEEPRPAAAQPEPVGDEPPAHAHPAEAERAPAPRPGWRRGNELRLGERWKRRLPQFLR
ncbi:hypothetical protein ACRAWG_06865 [Methylobacterium sp. P31]